MSTVITSPNLLPLVVDRTMFWGADHYGSHGGTATEGPSRQWLFAEGAEGFFNTYVLLGATGGSRATICP